MLKESHITRNDVTLRQASGSIAPPLNIGFEATMPTLSPLSRARPVTAARPKRSFRLRKLPSIDDARQ